MTHCHEEDQRQEAHDILARSRRCVWIPKGYNLARQVVNSCMLCCKKAKQTVKQIMAQIPDDTLHISPPFTAAALDLMGSYSVRGMGGGARKQMKVWGLLIMCTGMPRV